MKKQTSPYRIAAVIAALILGCSLWAAGAMAAGPGTVTMTVTVAGKKDTSPPVVTKDDVEFFLNKQRTQVGHWQHADKLFLAVLIDDSLRSDIANQWSDLKAFLTSQPDTTYVLVGYIRNGAVSVAQDFTNDHELAAKALRIPIGGGGAFSSPYLALQDLMKRLPETTANDRRSVLLISSGIDYFRGEFELVDPDLDSTISRAQKENINVWSIYAQDSGHRGRGFFVATRAQSNLSQLSGETGGEAFYLSTSEPVTLKPYFDELTMHLNNQYLLTFNASGGQKGRFERTRVATELPYAEFMAASQAFLPADK
jgi:VWFA-related protein